MSPELPPSGCVVDHGLPRREERVVGVHVRGVLSSLDRQWSRVFAAVGVVSSCAWLAVNQSAPSAASSRARAGVERFDASVELELSPLPSAPTHCRAHGDQALAHARLLEQLASASWERVPFAPGESPRAVAQIAEAEACFAAAHDRTGRTRAAAVHSRYSADLERRVARARLLLRVAMRAEQTEKRAPSTGGEAVSAHLVPPQLTVLLALFERAPPSAHAYRTELEQLARHYGAERPTTTTSTENTR